MNLKLSGFKGGKGKNKLWNKFYFQKGDLIYVSINLKSY